MKKLGKAFAAIAIAGAVAAGGSAFTNSNTVVNSTAGIKETVVTGIDVTSVDYDIIGDGINGANITKVNIVQTDAAGLVDDNLDVKVYFNDTTTAHSCGVGAPTTDPNVITYECAVSPGQALVGVTKLFITAVSNDVVA